MFPARTRWGSVTEKSLRALDVSWGGGADSPPESLSSWRLASSPVRSASECIYRGVLGPESLGVRMLRALRQ